MVVNRLSFAVLAALLCLPLSAMAQSASGSNTAVGVGSSATGGTGNTAVGQGATANCTNPSDGTTGNCTAIGAGATATGNDATSVGQNASSALNGVALGESASAGSNGDIAIGESATTTTGGGNSIAIGLGAVGAGPAATTVGSDASANAFGTALGFEANASAPTVNGILGSATAIGSNSSALGGASVAVGSEASVAAGTEYGVAIGYGASSTANDAIAIGSGSVADQADTISFGNVGMQRRLVNLAPGINLNDGVNVSQLGGFATAFGAGSNFNGGVFTPPSFDLSGNLFNNVNSALLYLNGKIGSGSGIPGPQGPAGPVGPQGPAGQNGTGSGGVGCSSGAVCYDNASKSSITLQGTTGTQIHNVAAATSGNDAVNLSQLQQSETTIQNDDFNAISNLGNQINTEIQNLSHRVDGVGAMSAALTMMASATNGSSDRVSAQAGVGMLNGQPAIAIGLRAQITRRVGIIWGVSHSSGQTMGGLGISVGLGR